MRKVHVLLNKESVEEQRLVNCTVVVVDVFLATSTITTLLAHGIEPVYAVENAQMAKEWADTLQGPVLILGESEGNPLDGFLYPDPTLIREQDEPTQAIICSTNGTRAIQKVKKAKSVFISSLMNGHMVAQALHREKSERSIVIIASGNNPTFSFEDLVGAGQVVSHLSKLGMYALTDAALVAKMTYEQVKDGDFKVLQNVETARLLKVVGFDAAIHFVMDYVEQMDVVPILDNGQIIAQRRETIHECNEYKHFNK